MCLTDASDRYKRPRRKDTCIYVYLCLCNARYDEKIAIRFYAEHCMSQIKKKNPHTAQRVQLYNSVPFRMTLLHLIFKVISKVTCLSTRFSFGVSS